MPVATRAGARVLPFRWIDDFAAARNHGITCATGSWVLVLDADERLAPGSAERLRSTLVDARFDGGLMRMHEAAAIDSPVAEVLSGRARLSEPQLLPRLFRRTDDLAFERPIHENIVPWLRRRGMRVAAVDADIVHLGATAHVVQSKDKSARNIRMLTTQLEREPADIEAYGYLAHEYLRAGGDEAAARTAEAGWSRVAGHADATSIHRLATARALLTINRGQYEEARETVRVARGLEGDSPDLAFFLAYADESEAMAAAGASREALLESAVMGYGACMAFAGKTFAQAFVHGASSWHAATRLGTVLLQLGRYDGAHAMFGRALEARPGDRAPALGKAEASIAAGQAKAGLRQLDGLIDGGPDAWTLAALAAETMGEGSDARLFAGRARQTASRGFVAGHRRAMLRALIERLAA